MKPKMQLNVQAAVLQEVSNMGAEGPVIELLHVRGLKSQILSKKRWANLAIPPLNDGGPGAIFEGGSCLCGTCPERRMKS